MTTTTMGLQEDGSFTAESTTVVTGPESKADAGPGVADAATNLSQLLEVFDGEGDGDGTVGADELVKGLVRRGVVRELQLPLRQGQAPRGLRLILARRVRDDPTSRAATARVQLVVPMLYPRHRILREDGDGGHAWLWSERVASPYSVATTKESNVCFTLWRRREGFELLLGKAPPL